MGGGKQTGSQKQRSSREIRQSNSWHWKARKKGRATQGVMEQLGTHMERNKIKFLTQSSLLNAFHFIGKNKTLKHKERMTLKLEKVSLN